MRNLFGVFVLLFSLSSQALPSKSIRVGGKIQLPNSKSIDFLYDRGKTIVDENSCSLIGAFENEIGVSCYKPNGNNLSLILMMYHIDFLTVEQIFARGEYSPTDIGIPARTFIEREFLTRDWIMFKGFKLKKEVCPTGSNFLAFATVIDVSNSKFNTVCGRLDLLP